MAEETTPAPGANDASGKPPEPKPTETPLSAEQLQNSLNAARRREQEATDKLKEATERLNALEAKQKEREETELKEKEEWQKLAEKHEARVKELEPFKEKFEAWELAEAAEIEKQLEGLSDNQKTLVNALPLSERRKAIAEFKNVSSSPSRNRPPNQGGPGGGESLTIEDVTKMRNEGNPEWVKAYQKLREERK